ncbi:hypothetical protein [Cytobacillus massiliigabonensis]|uniref:hypothetical protein n=1 Tax=Cytobacillus massiliigabonensis TaxID=1871011 RepID=UPI000C814C78|nr:hypothetical protein [Cytobacillus massiliigabonensis]
MKDKIQSYEEFEKRLKSQVIPEIEDVATQAITRKKTPIFLRASFITIVLTVCLSVSIAAAVNYTGWKFFDSEGNQVFEVRTMTEEEAEPNRTYNETYKKYKDVMEEIQKDIPKGQFKYFFVKEAYEEIGEYALTMLLNGEEIENVEQIPTDIREFLYLKNEILSDLVLKTGTMYYDIPKSDVNLSEEMYKEAKEKNLEYIIKDGILTTDISSIILHYESKVMNLEEGRNIQMMISPAKGAMLTTGNLAGYTQLTEAGTDFLYGDHKIYFIKEDGSKKFLITISTSWRENAFNKDEEKEALIAIAKTILN